MDRDKILLDMAGDVKATRVEVKSHGRQLETIFKLMNEGGCTTGKSNAVAIKWMWAIGSIVTVALFFVIGYFHLG